MCTVGTIPLRREEMIIDIDCWWGLKYREILMQDAMTTLGNAFMLSKWYIVILAYKSIMLIHFLPTFSRNLTIKWYYHFIMFINLNWSFRPCDCQWYWMHLYKSLHGKTWSSQGKPDTVEPNSHYGRQLCSQITPHFTLRQDRMLKRPLSSCLCPSEVTHYFSSANSEMFHRFRPHSIII